LLTGSQAIVPVVDHGLRKRNVAAFDPAACSRQIRKGMVVLKRSEAGHGATVLGDYDFPSLLHVVE
ncbi:MAG: hypothetical protein QOE68_1605, partial [Thermoanaerobaculia bacterium]|nr:hypothetical protein [Thermoanaerobaculia bacterium]